MSDTPKKDADWKSELTAEEYHVCRAGGTEAPFTGEYWDCKEPGVYRCRCCGETLFRSDEKYDSGSGWPSFYDVAEQGKVETRQDSTHGMVRTEILCAGCGAHLGHVFPDGPQPTGLRYCVNSLSLNLDKNT